MSSDKSTPLPEIHLIVPPKGHEAATENLFKTADISSVLAWRIAASCAKILTDTELNPVMTEALQKGHPVVVWHGHDRWSLHSLSLRLGQDYVNLSKRLSWAQLTLPANAPDIEWSHLFEQLNKPDEADLRRYLNSEREVEPQWEVSEVLNTQGLKAFRNWVKTYLDPALQNLDDDELLSEDSEGGLPSEEWLNNRELGDSQVEWPWKNDPVWEGKWEPID